MVAIRYPGGASMGRPVDGGDWGQIGCVTLACV